ncbi:MAG: NAD(P)H-dependent oxidoreductase [Deltaproteobacteria bacterium]|nr:NAD(P)H-dependent oxidoreductase [Deltaproteobacteria bacterium]
MRTRTGTCRIADDHPPVAARCHDADAVALASPVYWCGFPGMTKNFIDRFQAYWARRYMLGWPDRRGPDLYLLAVGGARSYRNFDPLLSTMKYLGRGLYGRFRGHLLYPDIEGRGRILGHANALRCAFALGFQATLDDGGFR